METLLWFFVFTVWFCWRIRDEDETMQQRQWYLVYRYKWVGRDLVKEPLPVDGVFATHGDAASAVAATRNDYKTDERFLAFWCSSAAQRMQAAELDGRHQCEWWSITEFVDFMRQPAYDETRTR